MASFPLALPHRALPVLLWVALICWAIGILWLSSLTPKELPQAAFLLSDKINHFLAFAAGGWLAASALRVSFPRSKTTHLILTAIALLAVFGALDETFQEFTPGRQGGDPYDWLADFFGAAAGASFSLLTYGFLERLFPRR